MTLPIPPPAPDIICIGAVLWDIIGRAPTAMHYGADVAGRITRLPGGVAMNVAMTMRRFGLVPTLLTAIGQDAVGDELIASCEKMEIDTSYVYRDSGLPTDRYMAVEDINGVIAAIADAHSLETAGADILTPLMDGRLGSAENPWTGLIALDGNLTEALLAEISVSPLFAAASLSIAPASPGKAERLRSLIPHPRATLYLNLEEAGLLCHGKFSDSETAAQAMLALGARRVIITDGPRGCSDALAGEGILTDHPPQVRAGRCTGAGDTFLAAHIVSERAGKSRAEALSSALEAAAIYVSGEVGL
jgi:sugar/nucleoside kinase (ribokinase family)